MVSWGGAAVRRFRRAARAAGPRSSLLALLGLVAMTACAPRLAAPEAERLLGALFAPPTPAEMAAVRAEWERRDTGVHGWRVEWQSAEAGRRTLVVSHLVDGFRHYGLVRVPAAGARRPVLVVAHGGDDGAARWQFFREGPLSEEWVQVVPSFRSERLYASATRWYQSEGPPSPWDRDVDDALALLNGVLAHLPEADGGRVAALGRSRGAGVALLMAARDPRIRAVVNFSGPTDFFLPEVRSLAGRALRTRLPRLPGAGYLADSVLFALRDGRIPLPRARLELLRRSPAWFAAQLPPTQTHHGSADDEVPVAHGERLATALRSVGPAGSAWEFHRYPDGGHRPGSLHGSRPRAEAFLRRWVLAPDSIGSFTSASAP